MRGQELQRKLIEMQTSTGEQLDEKVAGKIDKTVPGTLCQFFLRNLILRPPRIKIKRF